MTTRIVNPECRYEAGGSITMTCTLEILAGANVVDSRTFTASKKLSDTSWKQELVDSLRAQCQSHANMFKELVTTSVVPQFPGATSFGDVATQLGTLVSQGVTI